MSKTLEEIKYIIVLNKDITDDLLSEKNVVLLNVGERIKITYNQFRSMCSNSYMYIPINVSNGVNIAVKIHLDDLALVYRVETTNEIVAKPYVVNPEELYPD